MTNQTVCYYGIQYFFRPDLSLIRELGTDGCGGIMPEGIEAPITETTPSRTLPPSRRLPHHGDYPVTETTTSRRLPHHGDYPITETTPSRRLPHHVGYPITETCYLPYQISSCVCCYISTSPTILPNSGRLADGDMSDYITKWLRFRYCTV